MLKMFPAGLIVFFLRCLHPHPSERFQSLNEAQSWLQNHAKKSFQKLPPILIIKLPPEEIYEIKFIVEAPEAATQSLGRRHHCETTRCPWLWQNPFFGIRVG